MPSDEYGSIVRGGLKLKGAGVTKKKKKSKPKPSDPSSSTPDPKTSALQKALEEEDAITVRKAAPEEDLDEAKLRELEEKDGDGKTVSERAHEEMRRKRVGLEVEIEAGAPLTHR